MAKIMLGPIAGAVSGSVGNTTFSHNRGGAYMRVRAIPTKVINTYTVGIRDIMAIASRAWGALTTAQQAAWNTWAQSNPITDRLGQKQVLFGNAAYVKLNARLLFAGDTAIDIPPITAAPAPLTSMSCAVSAGGGTAAITFAPTPLEANEKLWCELAVFDNPGQNYFQNLLKTVHVSAAAVVTGEDIAAEWILRFGTLIEGQRFVLKCSVFEDDTGLMSGPVLYRGAVAA